MPDLEFLGAQPLRDRFRLEYQADHLYPYPKIVITGQCGSGLEVRVHFSDAENEDRILLDINHPALRIKDLLGNGPDTGRSGKGYGRLVVQLAIQTLRKMSGTSVDAPISGTITDSRPEVAAFWRKFGLTATGPKGDRHGSITGKLSELQPEPRDYKAGNTFDVAMDLSWFRVVENHDIAPLPRVRM